MEKYIIDGGVKLKGKIRAQSAKNAVLPLLAASILTDEQVKIRNIPIINGLTDYCHPCQVLADLMTIREYKGGFAGNKLCYIGDGNNMTNSLIVGGIKMGM